ncbi:hypothetical protein ACFLWG_02885 [Chloroflexota bacterium]
MSLDLDEDGDWDINAGVGWDYDIGAWMDIYEYTVNTYNTTYPIENAQLAFGVPLPSPYYKGIIHGSPTALEPDLEFTINHFSVLSDNYSSSGSDSSTEQFIVRVKMMSDHDNGIGEDYVWGLDFGDAPDPYPTRYSDNGSRHKTLGNIFLGSVIDHEHDGKPDENAEGDDTDLEGDDEDGVVFLTRPLVPNNMATVNVTVHAVGLLGGVCIPQCLG